MSDKPVAILMTAVAVAPLCLICVLGPAALVAAGGLLLAWFGGFGMPLIASVLAVGGWLVWRTLQRRSAVREAPKRELAASPSGEPSGHTEKQPVAVVSRASPASRTAGHNLMEPSIVATIDPDAAGAGVLGRHRLECSPFARLP